jgi:Ca-activated chloride channel homolog
MLEQGKLWWRRTKRKDGMKSRGRPAWILAAILLLPGFSRASLAAGEPAAPRQLPAWPADLDLLATDREKEVFFALQGEAERQLFLQQFWQARDPIPQTSRNELRETWESRLAEADRRWHGLADDRSRVFLLRGEPSLSFEARCAKSGSFEIWIYEPGFRIERRLVVAFLAGAAGAARLWRPGTSPDPAAVAALEPCSNQERFGDEARWLRLVGNDRYGALLAQALSPPRPREWISGFRPVPLDAAQSPTPLAAEMDVEYVAPRDSKVVVRVMMLVSASSLPSADGLEFSVGGEVLRGGKPLEMFWFQLNGRPNGPAVPLVFERLLAPGEYLLRVRLEHVASRRIAMLERRLSVPAVQLTDASPAGAAPHPAAVAALSSVPRQPDLKRILSEADAALTAQQPCLQILPPLGQVLVGRVGISVRVKQAAQTPADQRIERVSFTFDGRPLLTRNHPPFDLMLDLGPVPRLRKLRAEGISGAGKVVAHDELLLNAATQSFRIHLREPRPGRPYRQSLRIAAEVMPPGAAVERVELWFGEDRIATLYQPPYSLPFVLPREGQAGYVRAVAFREGGGSSEDVVFVNTPVEPDEMDVRVVELYATVQNGRGQPVTGGLDAESFAVLEDGVRQPIREVKQVGDTPIRLVTLIDSSGSMEEEMAATRQAALSFLGGLLRPQDQAAVIAFNRSPKVTVPLTGNLSELEKGLETILAESDTALYDSLAYSLLYLGTAQGQRAVLLLTDGEDTTSRLTFGQILETARRTGIAVYVIGLGVSGGLLDEPGQRLARLARVTGGKSFFIRKAAELSGIYAQIEKELRAQYKIAYQSSNTGTDDAFRAIQVRLKRDGLEARTISGYYP